MRGDQPVTLKIPPRPKEPPEAKGRKDRRSVSNARRRDRPPQSDGADQELTDRLEQGVKDLFESDRYAAYLSAMSKFHSYSANNLLLILLQCPHATQVADTTPGKMTLGAMYGRMRAASRSSLPVPIRPS